MKHKFIFFLIVVVLLSCQDPEPRKPVVRNSSSFLKESIVRNKAINKLEEKALKELMRKDSIHNYVASEMGFWYYYNVKDSTATRLPKKGDEVIFTYQIKNIEGEVLYSEEELGVQNYLVDKQELITGLQDGIKLMKEGEKVTFLFPSHKAYGYSGYEKIASNQPLMYQVSLNKIIVNN